MKKIVIALLSLLIQHEAAWAQTTPTAAKFASGSLAFGSITASYVQVLASGQQYRNLRVLNSTNIEIQCSWDDGTTQVNIPTNGVLQVDVRQLSLFLGATAFKCKHGGVAPTSGAVSAFAMY